MASRSTDPKIRPEPLAIPNLDRVVVVGTSGSGKTTLARALASQFDVPFIEMDALNWGPNWVMRDTKTFRESVDRATSGKFWVADGNYGMGKRHSLGQVDDPHLVKLRDGPMLLAGFEALRDPHGHARDTLFRQCRIVPTYLPGPGVSVVVGPINARPSQKAF